jgi:hypothetical protein
LPLFLFAPTTNLHLNMHEKKDLNWLFKEKKLMQTLTVNVVYSMEQGDDWKSHVRTVLLTKQIVCKTTKNICNGDFLFILKTNKQIYLFTTKQILYLWGYGKDIDWFIERI